MLERSFSSTSRGDLARGLGLPALLAAAVLAAAVPTPAGAQGTVAPDAGATLRARDGALAATPALEHCERRDLLGKLWQRPEFSPRDRSLVTPSALVARDRAAELPRHLDLALDSGVEPAELSELITHLAFYAGWGNARAAPGAATEVFSRRNIGADRLPAAEPDLLPLDEAAEARRATRVAQDVRPTVPGLDQFTTDVLFRDLWWRPGLAPRDSSLVTVSAMITSGQSAQVPYHLDRAMNDGLTRAEAAEVVTHLAFYAGLPNAFSAVPVVKGVFDARGR